MRAIACMGAAVLCILMTAVQAQSLSPGDAFEAGTAAFEEGDHAAALAHFERALEGGMDGPAIHYNIGVCHYRLGHYAGAEEHFSLIAERYPRMRALAQYNLGLVALKRGDEIEAREYFTRAAEDSEDEKIRYLARRQLQDGSDEAPSDSEDRKWLTLVDAQLGHDDNVLLLADEVTLPDGQSAESSFVELWALITGPLSSQSGFRVDGSLYVLRYPDASIFDQTVLQLGVPYRWSFGSWQAEAGPQVSHTTLDGDALETRAGAGVRLTRDIGARSSIGLRYVHDEIQEGESRFAFLEGSRDWLQLRVDRRGVSGRLTASYSIESNDRTGASVSPDRNRLTLRYRHRFNARWEGDLSGSWRESRYRDLADPRDEDLLEWSVAATRSLKQGWQLRGSLFLADNDSTLDTVAYDRRRVSLGISKQF